MRDLSILKCGSIWHYEVAIFVPLVSQLQKYFVKSISLCASHWTGLSSISSTYSKDAVSIPGDDFNWCLSVKAH